MPACTTLYVPPVADSPRSRCLSSARPGGHSQPNPRGTSSSSWPKLGLRRPERVRGEALPDPAHRPHRQGGPSLHGRPLAAPGLHTHPVRVDDGPVQLAHLGWLGQCLVRRPPADRGGSLHAAHAARVGRLPNRDHRKVASRLRSTRRGELDGGRSRLQRRDRAGAARSRVRLLLRHPACRAAAARADREPPRGRPALRLAPATAPGRPLDRPHVVLGAHGLPAAAFLHRRGGCLVRPPRTRHQVDRARRELDSRASRGSLLPVLRAPQHARPDHSQRAISRHERDRGLRGFRTGAGLVGWPHPRYARRAWTRREHFGHLLQR